MAGEGRRATVTAWEWVAIAWLGAIVVAALAVPILPLWDPEVPDFTAYLAPPSATHPLGTDELGRDILSRSLHGARISLSLALAAVSGGLVFGLGLGMLAGYFRGTVDRIISVVTDVVLAFPVVILIMVVVAVRGPSYQALIVGMAVGTMPAFARMARAHTLTWAKREFVMASAGLGARHPRLLLRSVLPMVIPPLLVYGLIIAAIVMMAEGALSFLGFGVPAPAASWGNMIATGRTVMAKAPYVVAFPALLLLITVMSFNILGDGFDRRREARQ